MSWHVSPWVYPVWDSLSLLDLTISFSMLGKFSTIISSKFFLYPYFFSSAAADAAKSLQSCPTLCDPIDSSPPGTSVPGILQARILVWVAISFSNAWKWKVKVKRHTLIKLTKVKHKGKILKAAREKQQVAYKGHPIRLTADLSAETLQARREWQDIFKVLKGKNLQDYCTWQAFHSKLMEKYKGKGNTQFAKFSPS